ncbi:MAG TPA: hemerythrin domain-containing protein [Polyangiales bacterium]|nr:hemerythrin domain-containing protein [Polyangiales bacterium]
MEPTRYPELATTGTTKFPELSGVQQRASQHEPVSSRTGRNAVFEGSELYEKSWLLYRSEHREETMMIERRAFLRSAASTAGVVLTGCATTHSGAHHAETSKPGDEGEAEVTPGEDLMQEHGVLERVLLIYDEGARRIERSEPCDVSVIGKAAEIVRRFIEEYHEKNEEQFVFPRLRAANRELDLTAILLRQHQRGREVTAAIIDKASAPASPELSQLLGAFTRMYRPHAAREDTVLFPAFRDVVGKHGYHELGEQLEDKEHELFGEHGFEQVVAQVSQLEVAFGIADLSGFTP